MRLHGKRAFVTAAGQGIGRAIAEAYAREGAEVTATDIDGARLQGIGTHRHFALDVTDRAALRQAVEEAEADILVNCAGIVNNGTIADATDDEFDFAVALNVRSQFHAMQAALPGMVSRGGGSIVNISSVCSSIIAAPNRFLYGMTKAADYRHDQIGGARLRDAGHPVQLHLPGHHRVPSLQERLRAMGDYETARAAFVARQPMGRIGTAEEVAALALYLGSDESAFTTGQAHVIDGGWATG